MKRLVIATPFVVIAAAVGIFFALSPEEAASVTLAGQHIRVTIADTPEERERGLSGREGLSENEGMLFIFEQDGIYGFWMKDMLFSIDILWLASDGTVVHIEENVTPESYPAAYQSTTLARYVLEVDAGWSDLHAVETGERASIHIGQ